MRNCEKGPVNEITLLLLMATGALGSANLNEQ